MIPHFYESIPGWFDFQDIYREAVERASDGAVFVEVGSWLGRSTAFMAVEIANSGKKIAFYAVDTWQGSPAAQYQDVIAQHGGDIYHEFIANLREVRKHVGALRGDSALTAAAFQDRSIDLVFIDAAHDFHSVKRDVHAWLPKVKVGGVIAGHDANCPGLMNAVREYIPARLIAYPGASWSCTILPGGGHCGGGYGWATRELVRIIFGVTTIPTDVLSRVGVWDDTLGALGSATALDYHRRLHLAGCDLPRPFVSGNLEKYIAKWGGPPSEETFDFPYGVTTKDW